MTAEINPPKGTDVTDALSKAEALRHCVDAFNLTDQHTSIMSAHPLALARLLQERGLEPILQVTCRDRNRIALQSDLLAASILGVQDILCITGDPVQGGDHPEARGVFDLEAIALLRAASTLMAGRDLGGNSLKGTPTFCLGAVVDPGAANLDEEIARMEQKAQAGAAFFQTQAIFDVELFARFVEATRHLNVPVLAGILLLKSATMARRLRQTLPGIHIPEALFKELDQAEERTGKGIELAGRLIQELRGLASGVHLMALGWEHRIPQVLEASGLVAATSGTKDGP